MSWLTLPRKPEPEEMGEPEQVDAYASAAAQHHLDSIDNTLVEQVLSLGRSEGWLLDVGTGPGTIPLKLARRLPDLRVVGIDCSLPMIHAARAAAARQGLAERAFFLLGDGCRLSFRDRSFDLVLCNSVLHHLRQPVALLNEMGRVAKPAGVILLRDLRRPSRLVFPFHVRWYGRHYAGLMKKLFADSVRASYTGDELRDLLQSSALRDARLFYHERTHLGFVRDGQTQTSASARQ
jgi:ubiquinone/menaquinone biosynthesis C-methylase UbiE